MSLRSSVHIFSPKSEKVIKYITGEIATDRAEENAIDTYFDSIQDVLKGIDVDSEPLHDRERFYAKEITNAYPHYVPSFMIKRDLLNRGIKLNIYGDIIIFPHFVSCLRSRFFSCGDSLEGVMFHVVKDMSRHLKSKIVSYSLSIDEKPTPECRVYFAGDGKVCCVRRSDDPSQNTEKNCGLLSVLWPEVDWFQVIAQTDVMNFSNAVEVALQIPVDEDLSSYTYLRTQRLYGIYSAGGQGNS